MQSHGTCRFRFSCAVNSGLPELHNFIQTRCVLGKSDWRLDCDSRRSRPSLAQWLPSLLCPLLAGCPALPGRGIVLVMRLTVRFQIKRARSLAVLSGPRLHGSIVRVPLVVLAIGRERFVMSSKIAFFCRRPLAARVSQYSLASCTLIDFRVSCDTATPKRTCKETNPLAPTAAVDESCCFFLQESGRLQLRHVQRPRWRC
jgi:hypothetical protein